MAGQTSNIITMLAALLTGGFLMVFIENQQIASMIAERIDKKMHSFFYSFTNYVKFISFFRTYYSWHPKKENSGNINKLKEDIVEISRYGGTAVMSGSFFSHVDFDTQKLDNVCNTINDIWYRIDQNRAGFNESVTFNDHFDKKHTDTTLEFLRQISPKYSNTLLSKDLLYEVSGDFYDSLYRPIQTVLPQYEYWKRKERIFRYLSLATIVVTICSMLFIMILPINISHRLFVLLQENIPILVSKFWIEYLPFILCLLCSGLLLYELYKLVELERIANEIMR